MNQMKENTCFFHIFFPKFSHAQLFPNLLTQQLKQKKYKIHAAFVQTLHITGLNFSIIRQFVNEFMFVKNILTQTTKYK
jgi:hypothetical protein